MATNCGDTLSLQDLQTAKKHQIFEAEVITGKAGGVAGGADIDYATNQVTGQTQKTMPAILRDIGFTPASFDFTTGGTLGVNDRDKVVYDPVSKTWYSWGGALPHVIAAGTNPVGVADWTPQTDPDLRTDLASPDAGKGVSLVNGAAKQIDVDKINLQNSDYAYIEDYAGLVSGGDWSDAIQAAFDTGKPVNGAGLKQYPVTKIINTNGQGMVGNWSINTSRYALGNVVVSSEIDTSGLIRMVYVSSAYDLSELLHIKSLGINTIAHYCFWADNPQDAAGTVTKLLNNAQSAGMKVLLGTESAEATENLSAFVTAYESHPAVMGFSVYDEPATRGISVTQQNAKINTMRPLTGKALTVVDLAPPGGPFEQAFSTNYDIVFVDSYAIRYSTGDLASWVVKDLNKMRYDFGIVKAMTQCSRVIPVVSSFIDHVPSGIYSQNISQIVQTSDVFGLVGKGEFGAFVWDNYVGTGAVPTGQLRDQQEFKNLIKRLSSQVIRKDLKTDAVLFGGGPNTGSTQWPLTGILSEIPVKDTSTTDSNAQRNAYPVRVVTAASNTDRTVTTPGTLISGIGLKGADCGFVSGLKLRKNLRAHLEIFSIEPALSGNFNLKSTWDNGYGVHLIFNAGFSGNTSIEISSSDFSYGDNIVFDVQNAGDTTTTYRKFIRGVVINTDW